MHGVGHAAAIAAEEERPPCLKAGDKRRKGLGQRTGNDLQRRVARHHFAQTGGRRRMSDRKTVCHGVPFVAHGFFLSRHRDRLRPVQTLAHQMVQVGDCDAVIAHNVIAATALGSGAYDDVLLGAVVIGRLVVGGGRTVIRFQRNQIKVGRGEGVYLVAQVANDGKRL